MKFVKTPWQSPESKLDAADYCSVCLIDMNPKGKAKIKANCKLPVRASKGGPYNINGMFAAARALLGSRGGVKVPVQWKRKAARKLIRLFGSSGSKAPAALKNIAH